MKPQKQYLVIHQTRDREPTDYENLLADAIEQAYAQGVQELDALVARLNTDCVPSPGGKPWTTELFASEMKRLGA
jgi:hypothetical protein